MIDLTKLSGDNIVKCIYELGNEFFMYTFYINDKEYIISTGNYNSLTDEIKVTFELKYPKQ